MPAFPNANHKPLEHTDGPHWPSYGWQLQAPEELLLVGCCSLHVAFYTLFVTASFPANSSLSLGHRVDSHYSTGQSLREMPTTHIATGFRSKKLNGLERLQRTSQLLA